MSTPTNRILAAVEALAAEVQALRRELALQRPALDPADVALLVAVTESTGGLPFTSPEVLAHSRVDPTLKTALAQADCETPRDVSDVCRRLRDRPTSGVVLRRGPRTRSGYAWRVEPV